jgi:hypothetical protein
VPTSGTTYQGTTTIVAAGDYLVQFVFNTDQAPAQEVVTDQACISAGASRSVPEPTTLALLC